MAEDIERLTTWKIKVEGPTAGDIIKRSHPCVGYVPCDGRFLSVDKYPDLFKAIGFTFGESDPYADYPTYFRVPNLRARAVPPTDNFLTDTSFVVGQEYPTTPEDVMYKVDSNFAVMPADQVLEGQKLGLERSLLDVKEQRREIELAWDELNRRAELLEGEIEKLANLIVEAPKS